MQSFLEKFRQKYNYMGIVASLEKLRYLKVLIIGDAIIDQYHYSSSVGKSPKDNIIVVKYLAEENFAGGVLASANHIANFCDDVTLVTCLGKIDPWEGFIRKHLKSNINLKPFYREDTQTVVKRRYIEPNTLKKVFGVSYVDDYELPEKTLNEVLDFLTVGKYDLVVVNDFGHGIMDVDIIEKLNESGFLAVNTQTNTDNLGFNYITRYNRADFICLDEPEIRYACQDRYGNLEELMEFIAEKLNCDKMIVTHGQYDTLTYNGGFTRIPILSKEVKDTTGAGDAFFSIASLCVKSGMPMDLVGFIGNCVGALKVRTVCNRSPIDKRELYEFIRGVL